MFLFEDPEKGDLILKTVDDDLFEITLLDHEQGKARTWRFNREQMNPIAAEVLSYISLTPLEEVISILHQFTENSELIVKRIKRLNEKLKKLRNHES